MWMARSDIALLQTERSDLSNRSSVLVIQISSVEELSAIVANDDRLGLETTTVYDRSVHSLLAPQESSRLRMSDIS